MIHKLIEEINAERMSLLTTINLKSEELQKLRKLYTNDLSLEVMGLKDRDSRLLKAKEALQSICNHDWTFDNDRYDKWKHCNICDLNIDL